MKNTLLLLTTLRGDNLERLKRAFETCGRVVVLGSAADLAEAPIDQETSLLAFGTGVIVPGEILNRLSKPAYNLHAAPPEYPGRDPHHHAVFERVSSYGVTLHLMTPRVDEGPIVAVERFAVSSDVWPRELLEIANDVGLRLMEKLGGRLLEATPLLSLKDVGWGLRKTKRKNLAARSHFSPTISSEEFAHLFRSFDGGEHDNLTVSIHGHVFRIDKRTSCPVPTSLENSEFTEEGFRNILRALNAGGYQFAHYGTQCLGRHVLWRHDVDFSMHRAARLAQIEAEEGATATFFLNPHCTFYSLLEPEVTAMAHRIADMGHDIGLHFDASAYPVAQWRISQLERAVTRERKLLEEIIERPIRSVSWHNPDLSNLLEFKGEDVAGLVNAYSASLQRDYVYCSDSNGYWRFKPMMHVIAEGAKRLHLLTHPEWWTPFPMSPSSRVDRAILGRAQRVRAAYDALLERGGRRNVKT